MRKWSENWEGRSGGRKPRVAKFGPGPQQFTSRTRARDRRISQPLIVLSDKPNEIQTIGRHTQIRRSNPPERKPAHADALTYLTRPTWAARRWSAVRCRDVLLGRTSPQEHAGTRRFSWIGSPAGFSRS